MPPPLITNAIDKETSRDSTSNETETKGSQLRHCLLPACTLRDRSGITKVQCKVVLREDSFFKTIRQRMRDITAHPGFDAVIVVLILLNTIVLALYHHGIDPEFRHVLDNVNLVSDRIHDLKWEPRLFNYICKRLDIIVFSDKDYKPKAPVACIFSYMVSRGRWQGTNGLFAKGRPRNFRCCGLAFVCTLVLYIRTNTNGSHQHRRCQ